MATRSNACSELTRFWLETRHGLLVSESVPVPVHRGQSDIDFIALHPSLKSILLPNGRTIGPRLIVETKDEHDFDPKGLEFGKLLRADVARFSGQNAIPNDVVGKVKFSMLRQTHYDVASGFFGSDDFDRLFVVHAIDNVTVQELREELEKHRIYWLSIRELVRDLRNWYQSHPRPTGLRHSLMGDTFHLLFGYCGVETSEY